MRGRALLLVTMLPAVGLLDAGESRELDLRAFLHDPLRPAAEFQVPVGGGQLVPLALAAEGFPGAQRVALTDDRLVIHGEDGAVAARSVVPAGVKRVIAIIAPGPPKAALPYQMLVIDDSAAAYPWGTCLGLNLMPQDIALQAGEHRLMIRGGGSIRIPPVKQVNEFNMAQTNFYIRAGEQWMPFTERRLKYVADTRRVFLVYATPGSTQPFVTTVVDYQPQAVGSPGQ